ncbi:MAG TPA: hypothetical protein VFH88_09910 [Candidatus Krumholzibacteria bacterium]|nr:hypothetical protein [Candidatus Krumholzibacteria bacterium]
MGLRLNSRSLLIVSLVVAGLVFLAERLLEPAAGGALTITMALFLGLAEGAIVLMAGAEISDGHWHRQLLQSAGALLYIIPAAMLLFIVNLPQLSIYPWWEHQGVWFNHPFFIARNLIVMGLMFVVARLFVVKALRGDSAKNFWGVALIFLFVWHMTMIGIEWFMSIEKPWFSTLFGAFVMVSGFLAGICTCALIIFSWRSRTDKAAKLIQKSVGGLIFGFATFWAYFYFSQLIVIWYGNIPEETGYLVRRVGAHSPYHVLGWAIFIMIWMFPFLVLLSRKNKTRAWVTSALAIIILTGITTMFWLMLAPVVHVSIPLLAIEIGLMALLTASAVRSRETLLPPLAGPVPAEEHGHGHSPEAAGVH